MEKKPKLTSLVPSGPSRRELGWDVKKRKLPQPTVGGGYTNTDAVATSGCKATIGIHVPGTVLQNVERSIVKRCKPPQPTEHEIQDAICEYLSLRDIFYWRTNTGAARYPGNDGKERMVRFGFPGVSDIIGIVRHLDDRTICNVGQFFAIECKRPGKKLTLAQEAFKIAVIANGGLFLEARNLQDVIDWLRGNRA